jgi:hypothetical protein
MKTLQKSVLGGLLGISLLWSVPAEAFYLGNPAPHFKKGDMGVGLQLSDQRETLFFGIALLDSSVLEVFYGNVDADPLSDGTEYGVSYRQGVGQAFNLGDFPVTLGFLAGYRMGKFEVPFLFQNRKEEFEFTILDVGFGGDLTPLPNLNTYAAVIYERVEQELDLPVFGKVSATDSNVGLLLGVEYWALDRFIVGLELHPGLEDNDISIFGEVKF